MIRLIIRPLFTLFLLALVLSALPGGHWLFWITFASAAISALAGGKKP
jgi:hypothetical protein